MSDESAVDRKINELAQIAHRALRELDDSAKFDSALDIVRRLAAVTPPEVSATIGLAVMTAGGVGGGVDVKPGNVTLNMRKLVVALAGAAVAAAGVPQAPWTAIFAALVIWDSLYSLAKVDLSEKEASALWTLWQLRDKDSTVSDAGLLQLVNQTRKDFGRSELSKQELEDALEKLVRIRAVERAEKDRSRWWLREWVSVHY